MNVCSISGCEKQGSRRTLCHYHYNQARTRGTIPLPPRRGRTPCPPCSVEGCEKATASPFKPLCKMHQTRQRRHGDVHAVRPNAKAGESYRGAHDRIARTRGPASAHPCIDCGRDAQEWSYTHSAGERELVDPEGKPYSFNPSDYAPRCKRDHLLYDYEIKHSTGQRQTRVEARARQILEYLRSNPDASCPEMCRDLGMWHSPAWLAIRWLIKTGRIDVTSLGHGFRPARFAAKS